ncbi:exported hypothetical protein [Mesorhizobium escarrei]|uniref:Uncharacterized protein n=1 Tax=Mesorhizobium escarrei TaxID=666018 RepID=A0ABM9E0L9_9HYPH|nr:exported hypothetical protein [Mesorhizobium escarrei]
MLALKMTSLAPAASAAFCAPSLIWLKNRACWLMLTRANVSANADPIAVEQMAKTAAQRKRSLNGRIYGSPCLRAKPVRLAHWCYSTRQTFKRLEYLSTNLISQRPSEGRWRVDPKNAGSLLADVAVMMRQLRPEHERIAGGEIMALAIDDQLYPAGKHVADFLADMLDGTFALAVRLDMMDVALQQVSGRIWNDAFERDALAAPQRVERDQWPRACAEHNRLVVVDLFEHPADIGLQNFDQTVKHGQGWRSLAVLDLGQKAFRAVRSCRQRLQRHAPCLPGEAQPRSKPRGIYGGVRFGLRPSPIDFVHPFANHSTVMGQLSREQKAAATDLQVVICQFRPSRASIGF